MPMRNCSKCLENNWSFEKIENIIRATCRLCDYEVEFEARKSKYNYEAYWVRFENKYGKTTMFTKKYPEGVDVYIDPNIDWKKQHPIRIGKKGIGEGKYLAKLFL